MKKRNINIDLIKCIAVFSVISVHYFANVGLYKTIIEENKMYIGIIFRTLFMICVPLFIITTGYLMKNKMLSKKYYLGAFRVIIIYILNTLLDLLPEKINVHLINIEDDFIKTLKSIFEKRLYICTDCDICKTYKLISKELSSINQSKGKNLHF